MDVEATLLENRREKGPLLFALVDSEASDADAACKSARQAASSGASAILVGGSTTADQVDLARTVEGIKRTVDVPVILFPGNITGVVAAADAILFSSLMNSENPYYITQAQALAAPSVLRHGLEVLPTAYLVVGEGTTAWFVGSARAIPHDKPAIAAAYSLAARFLGMRFVYLEAGSGAAESVRAEMIAAVRRAFDGFLIVGGGIRDAEAAERAAGAGADAIVVGTLLESGGPGRLDVLGQMVKAMRQQGDGRVGP